MSSKRALLKRDPNCLGSGRFWSDPKEGPQALNGDIGEEKLFARGMYVWTIQEEPKRGVRLEGPIQTPSKRSACDQLISHPKPCSRSGYTS